MFRMGGSTGTGITSGLPRASYAEGPGPEGVKSTLERLQEASGPARKFGIEDFLIPFGLNLASATPRGNLLATAAGAAKEPAADLMAMKRAEDDFQRKLRLEAAGIDIDAEKKAEKIIQTMLECDIELYKIDVTGYEDVGSMTREQFENKKLTASFVDADTRLMQSVMSI